MPESTFNLAPHYYLMKTYMWAYILKLPSSSACKIVLCLPPFHTKKHQILNPNPLTLM